MTDRSLRSLEEIKREFIARLCGMAIDPKNNAPLTDFRTCSPGPFEMASMADDLRQLDKTIGWFADQVCLYVQDHGAEGAAEVLCNGGSCDLLDSAIFACEQRAESLEEAA